MGYIKLDSDNQHGLSAPSGLSVVIPAYNEEIGIVEVLSQLEFVLQQSGIDHEILLVDDGSTDKTTEAAGSIANVRVIKHRQNRGYGAALKTGIHLANYEYVCITDADGTYPNDRIPELLSLMIAENYAMVVGARVGNNIAIPLIRRPAKWVISKLARVIAGMEIPDLNSGLRIFRRSAVLRFEKLLPDGFSFTTTITLGMLSNNYSVAFIPIEYFRRIGKSKIKPIPDTLNFIQLILRIALYFSPLKIFLPASGFVFLIGLIWGVVSYKLFGNVADASMAVILMAAVQIAVVGLLADLINHRLPGFQSSDDFEDRRL